MGPKKRQSSGVRKFEGIHFVNARPSSETERLKTQRLVRAHVGQWISDHTKEKGRILNEATSCSRDPSASVSRNKLDGDGFQGDPTSSQNEKESQSLSTTNNGSSCFTIASRPSPPPTRYITASRRLPPNALYLRPSREWRRSQFPPLSTSDCSECSDDAEKLVRSTESVTVVPWNQMPRIEPQVSVNFDPFDTLAIPFPADVVNRCENYLTSVLWPGLVPRSKHVQKTSEAWFPLSLSDPALAMAFMYGSLCHQRVQWYNQPSAGVGFGPKYQRIMQECELRAIRLINTAMKDPSRRTSDALLLSVTCMAHHQAMDEAFFKRRLPTPFKAPFQRLQWLSVYGFLPPNMVHIQGLLQLVKLRGGLKKLTTSGLAATMCFSDIFTASVLFIKPSFEFWPVDEGHYGMTLQGLLGFDQSQIDSGFGRFSHMGMTPQMAEVFHAIQCYINIIRNSLIEGYDVSLLTDQRNLTQYMTLSLPPVGTIRHEFTDSTQVITYEACRVACGIFAVGVIFPIPAHCTPLGRLAHQLQALLQDHEASDLWTSPHTRIALLWILTLGGIAATEMPERPFFVSALRQTLRRSAITSWQGLKGVLEMMLWYDGACDESAEALFREASIAFERGQL